MRHLRIGATNSGTRLGWYMERAEAGEDIVVTHRGRPGIRLSAIAPELQLAA